MSARPVCHQLLRIGYSRLLNQTRDFHQEVRREFRLEASGDIEVSRKVLPDAPEQLYRYAWRIWVRTIGLREVKSWFPYEGMPQPALDLVNKLSKTEEHWDEVLADLKRLQKRQRARKVYYTVRDWIDPKVRTNRTPSQRIVDNLKSIQGILEEGQRLTLDLKD